MYVYMHMYSSPLPPPQFGIKFTVMGKLKAY